jgi:hypothetical protein
VRRRSSLALVLLCACAGVGDAREADLGADFDAASAFLVAGMESYRFDRWVSPEDGSLTLLVTCGRKFKATGIGYGDAESIFVIDPGPAAAAVEDNPAHGEIVARVRGVPVRHSPPVLYGNESWTAIVERRFTVTATRIELIHAALERSGRRTELVRALGLPISPTWRASTTIVRRFAREQLADTTNPWSVHGWTPEAVRGVLIPEVALRAVIDGHVVESSFPAAGRTRIAAATETPPEAAEFYRKLCGLDGRHAPSLVRDETRRGVAHMHADFDDDGGATSALITLDSLFGWNILI